MERAWKPQVGPQLAAIRARGVVHELFFGGARGGGKTDFLLGDFLQDIHGGSPWRGILFRRSYPELDEVLARSRQIYAPIGATYRVSERTWLFPGGATLKLRHLDRDGDADRYQGHQYTWIGWDELTNWSGAAPFLKLKACLRSAHDIANKRIRASGNPGGPGHHWVKARFIDPAPFGFQPITDPETGEVRMFIPSRVEDNRILLESDPGYVNRLRGVGSVELVKAWLEGDWNAVIGAYFDCWDNRRHVVRPFLLPTWWTRFRSLDWGSARPFSVGWWAVVGEDLVLEDGRLMPRGALVRYREWYGASAPNVGLKMTADAVGKGILEREQGESVAYGVADPSIFAQDGGPSIAERMVGCRWRPGDNRRVAGADAMRRWMPMVRSTSPEWFKGGLFML
ncbi:MAG: hypothetical protein HQL59_11800, partial [Magnetococcales bacterium]|nr:hypothetical protein [Magnetococcales bacterium]